MNSLLRNDIDELLNQGINERVQRAKATGRKIRIRRLPRQPSVNPLIMKYQKALRHYFQNIRNLVETNVVSILPELVDETERDRAKLITSDSLRIDQGVARRLAELIRATRIQLRVVNPVTQLRTILSSLGGDLDQFSSKQTARVLKTGLGVNILEEPNMSETIEGFIEENTSLIEGLSEDLLSKVQESVGRGLRTGKRAPEIAKEILGSVDDEGFAGRFRKAETRAMLIARDQVSKLAGKMNELKQVSAGVERYIWRTVGDDRVRDEHAELEGEIFSWNDPPSIGHPGEPINCRCYAEPILSDLLPESVVEEQE